MTTDHRRSSSTSPRSRGRIGAEIRDLDLHATARPRRPLAAVRQALLDYKVIFFPGAPPEPRGAHGLRRLLRRAHRGPPRHPGPRGAPGGLRDRLHEGPRALQAGPRPRSTGTASAGTPTSPSWSARRSVPSSMPSSSRPPAGTPCGRTRMPPTRDLSQPIRDLVDGLTARARREPPVRRGSSSTVGQGEWDGETFTELKSGGAPGRAHPPRDRPSRTSS